MKFTANTACPQKKLDILPFHESIFPDGTKWTQFYRTESGYLLRFPGLSDFQVSHDGREIACFPTHGVTEATTEHLYLNQVLPLALAKQGKYVFHASAVEIDKSAIAFMGEAGRGKSTLAASFATDDFRFLTDDGLVLEDYKHGYQVLPSHPSIRLWEDSHRALIKTGVNPTARVQFTSKARFLAGDDIVFCDQGRPLKRIYFLGEGISQEPVFEQLKPADALIELLKHSFLLDIEEKEMLAAQFELLSSLVSQIIYYRLDYPRRFEDLARVKQAIVDHVQNVN